MSNQSVKEYIAQRKSDLVGNKAKADQLLEIEAMRLVHGDLERAAMVVRDVVTQANGEGYHQPVGVEDIISVATLIQAYLAPAYRSLIANGELERIELPVPTVAPSGIQKPGDLVS